MTENIPHIAAITFDVDGTLYDLPRQKLLFARHAILHPKVIRAWEREKQAMRGHHFENYSDELNGRIASSLNMSIERVADIMHELFNKRWLSTFSPKTPLKGMKELIIDLQRGDLPIGIISDHASAEKLKRMGLDGLWSVNIDCSALGALKPRIDGIEAAGIEFACDPQNILHIGDRADTDLAMTEAVGAQCLLRGRDWQNSEQLKLAISNITKGSRDAY
jgi:FMN phosphatase YigB (HAD superfamily)